MASPPLQLAPGSLTEAILGVGVEVHPGESAEVSGRRNQGYGGWAKDSCPQRATAGAFPVLLPPPLQAALFFMETHVT